MILIVLLFIRVTAFDHQSMILLLFLVICYLRISEQIYDVYAHYRPPVPGSMASISAGRQCFSDDQMYMGIAGSDTA